MKKYYYALFTESENTVEVEFPDLPGCVTFGSNWDEAFINAIDVLAGWLAHAESQYIKAPSPHNAFKNLKGTLIPVPIVNEIFESYQELKRINVIFPANVLNKIDAFRKKHGLKRSTFLLKASENYLNTMSQKESTRNYARLKRPDKHHPDKHSKAS